MVGRMTRSTPTVPPHTFAFARTPTGEGVQEQCRGYGGVGAVGAEDRPERSERELQEDGGAARTPWGKPQIAVT